MRPFDCPSVTGYQPLMIWLASATLFLLLAVPVRAQQPASESQLTPAEHAEKEWNRAMDIQQSGDHARAARLFLGIYQKFPQTPVAESSLWRALQYYLGEAMGGDVNRWQTVLDLSRRYIADFPDSQRTRDVFFYMGVVQYNRGRYRQALARFNLFGKRYPDAPQMARLEYLKAKCFVRTGSYAKARALYEQYAKKSQPRIRARGLAGLGEIAVLEGRYAEGLQLLRQSLAVSSDFFAQSPEVEVLRETGRAYLNLGNETEGRKYLLHYLNVIGNSSDQRDVLLEIAESYHRQGKQGAAQGLYETIIEQGKEHEKAVVVARFRVAQFLDDPASKLDKWQRPGDLTDSSGDAPYLTLLAKDYATAYAQDARRFLFYRYRARDDFDRALATAKVFLAQLDGATDGPLRQAANEMLLYVAEQYLAQGEDKKLLSFYEQNHRHVRRYPEGRLLYLVGQAFERLYLYDQAAVVYYRALGRPLSDGDKRDLYFRRVHVYLAANKYPEAELLLAHLRKIYQGDPALGEVYGLTGRLRKAQGKRDEAREYFGRSLAAGPLPETAPRYAAEHLELLLEAGLMEQAVGAYRDYAGRKLFSLPQQQQWLAALGKQYLDGRQYERAAALFEQALAEPMPQSGPMAQSIQVQLGNTYVALEAPAKAKEQFNKATAGPDPLQQRLAKEGLQDLLIAAGMDKIDLPAAR